MALPISFAAPNYAAAVELAVGPALFMSVSMLLNTAISTRLGQVTDRAKFLRSAEASSLATDSGAELTALLRRARLLHWAIRASSLGALMFALVITLSFLTPVLGTDLSMVLALCFCTALFALVTALFNLLREAEVAFATMRL